MMQPRDKVINHKIYEAAAYVTEHTVLQETFLVNRSTL
jgi:hypothetical protein